MPDKMSQEKARLLRALGAEVIITPTAVPPDHPENYIMKGRAIAAAHPNAIFADQHYNPVNPEVHYRTTGPEIWTQTDGKVTHFVCAPGTGGTVSGAGRYLKEQRPGVRVIAGDPAGSIYSEYARTRRPPEGHPYKVEGIGGDKLPSSLHWDVIDEWITVSDKDAMLMVRRLAKEEGLFAGGSTGVNLVAALDVARRVNDPQALVVTVLADTGERYLSKVYNDEWLRENQILEAERVSVAALLAARNSGAPPLISVAPTATVRQALNLMSTYNVSQLPVLDGGEGVGAVAEQVLMARALEDPATLDQPVQDVMDGPYPVVDADLPVERLTTLLSRETPAALVRRDGKIAGIVTRYDVLHQLAGIR
jgi:cystathionine beta-synthase